MTPFSLTPLALACVGTGFMESGNSFKGTSKWSQIRCSECLQNALLYEDVSLDMFGIVIIFTSIARLSSLFDCNDL